MTKGGKRDGAGRKPATPRPKPYSLRLETQAQHDKMIRLGGAKWVRRQIDLAIETLTKEPKCK